MLNARQLKRYFFKDVGKDQVRTKLLHINPIERSDSFLKAQS